MKDENTTHGLWAATAPDPPELERLQGDHHTDVVIIGSGYTGLSAALHLARAGKECMVIEARHVGFGGAGRNVGLVNAGLWLMPEDVIRLAGPDYGEKLISLLGASPDLVFGLIDAYDIPCEPLHNGTLHCADTTSGYKALQQREIQWQKRGAPVRLLERDETAKQTGTNAFYGALLDNRAGTIQPLAYAIGLARAALKEGAAIFEQSPVTGIEEEHGRYRVTTPNGVVTASSVIIAVHGYADHAFKHHHKNIVPFNFFQFATEPLDAATLKTVLPGRQGAWDTNLILSSYRLDAAGRLIVGSVGMVEGSARGLHKNWVKRTLKKIFPQVENAKIGYGWHGRIAMTTDHIPRFHILGKRMAMVTSFNGRGIGPGTVFGKLLAKFVTGGSSNDIPLPVSPIDPVSFRSLRGLFYEAGARVYHSIQRRI